jgi:23S rRNA pseudouridine2605 synthase
MEHESLLKTLVKAGLGSRRQVAEAIRQGMVAVNSQTIEDFRYPINRETDEVTVDGKPVEVKRGPLVYLVLNKPPGILSTTRDERGRRTVLDILPPKYRHLKLYPVGRLDKDSTGLLLLTNDGDLAYRLTHPRFEHEKEYLIQVNGQLRKTALRRLEQGIKLDDGLTSPTRVREIDSPPPYNYRLTIHEGRKRQIRRMLAALGYRVLALKRVRMGSLSLGNLKEGATRQLSAGEVRALIDIMWFSKIV